MTANDPRPLMPAVDGMDYGAPRDIPSSKSMQTWVGSYKKIVSRKSCLRSRAMEPSARVATSVPQV